MSQPKLTIDRIELADDAQVLDACETELVGWGVAEQAQLSTPAEDISNESRRLRAVIFLMVEQNMDRGSAEERYKRLLVDSKRTIPYLKERIQQLLEDGVIKQYEYEDYYNYELLTEADDFDFENQPIEHRSFDKIQALLQGLDDKDATRYAKLSDDFHNGSDKYRKLQLKCLGLDDEEIENCIIFERQKKLPTRLKARRIGFTRELAGRMEELFEKSNCFELSPDERQEKDNLIQLRSVCERANRSLEVRLALQDFGVEKMLEFIALQTKFDVIESQIDNVINSATGRLDDEKVRESTQSIVDSLASKMKLSIEEEKREKELRAELQKEPLLRQFINNYRDIMLSFTKKAF